MICKRVHYRGMVQGVGFRMITRRLAEQFAVAGYVKNLVDGRVEVVVAGDAEEIERFLDAVARRMANYIQGQDVQLEPPQALQDFEIRI
jgi:acylphosphatase